jgi:hypothetical protein
MKNVILPTKQYTYTREWLRSQPIKWRDLSSSACVPNWGEAICDKALTIGDKTCAEISYDLLKENYPHLHLKWRKAELELLDRRPPRLFQGPYVGECFYLDVKAAYHTFYQYLFLHSDYPYKRQRYPLMPIAEEFRGRQEPEWKIARNALVGICRSTKARWVYLDKTWETYKINKYLSPTLWAQLMGILNQIASVMYSFGAIWFNCDGFVFTSLEAYTKALLWFEEREIAIGDKGVGVGSIRGINSINIAGVKNTLSQYNSREVFHLEGEDIDHLKQWTLNRKVLQND